MPSALVVTDLVNPKPVVVPEPVPVRTKNTVREPTGEPDPLGAFKVPELPSVAPLRPRTCAQSAVCVTPLTPCGVEDASHVGGELLCATLWAELRGQRPRR